MIGCVAVAGIDTLPGHIRLLAIGAALVVAIVTLKLSWPSQALLHGPDRASFSDELWFANAHKAGYWACCAVFLIGAVITLVLLLGLAQPSAVTVAALMTLSAWAAFSILFIWFEWRSGD